MECEEPTRVQALRVQRPRPQSPSTLRMLRAARGAAAAANASAITAPTANAVPAPAARAAPAAAKPPRALALFREQAVAAHLATLRDSEVLRVAPPWVRGLVGFASLLTAALLAGAFVVEVDQTARGRGVLRVAGGVQTVASQTAGTVLEIGARSGDVVRAGDLLVRVDSTATKTALLEAERHIVRADEDVATFVARRDKEQTARLALLGQRASLLRKRVQSQNVSVSKLEEHLGSFERLVAEGLAPSMDRAQHEREIAAARRTSLQLEEDIATTNLQAVNTEAELAAELDRRKAEARRASDRRDALAFQLAQTEVRAPRSGRLEAMVAKAGEVVTVGGAIARLVPEGGARQVVVFLPEADRAFLREASDVRIELDQLPSGEFGALRAIVKRIAVDLASPADVSDALGDARLEGPTYRVELELASDGAAAQLEPFLRPGSQVTARFVLRKRRLASLLFSPLKKWLDR